MLAIDAVGLHYYLQAVEWGCTDFQLYRHLFEMLYSQSLCYLEEKEIEKYVGALVEQLKLGPVMGCSYHGDGCPYAVHGDHESYGQICRCRDGDELLIAIEGCRLCSTEFKEGLRCRDPPGRHLSCFIHARCEDVKAHCP